MWINLAYYRRNPLFLTELQKKIEILPSAEKQMVRILLIMNASGQYRQLSFALPKGTLLFGYRDLIKRYILAMINNMIVSFGGASMDLYFDHSDTMLLEMIREATEKFDVTRKDNYRSGYGSYINYINRMNTFLGLGRFRIGFKTLDSWRDPEPGAEFRVYEPRLEKKNLELLRRAAKEMAGKCFCSLDVGGNSIKGAVVSDGDITITKEFQWYPTGFKTADEMNNPQLLMIRFLSDYAGSVTACLDLEETIITEALERNALYAQVLAAAEYMENRGISPYRCFDAIVIGFPDIVVANKIAGGETFKQLGMKTNPAIDYETEFFKTSELNNLVRVFAKDNAPVIVLNDANTASYIISVEQSALTESVLDENGMFINTVGTEMGTGFISRGGTIQYIPMEGYQHVIDLGSTDYEGYHLDDVRTIRNTNTEIPGTVQKYVTQMGLFRMAISGFMDSCPEFIDTLAERNLIHHDPRQDHIEIVTKNRDKLTKLLTDELLTEENPVMEGVLQIMGRAMGILIDQDLLLFPEIKPKRLVSGGIMASDLVFTRFRDALRQYNPNYDIIRLDENTVQNPLLKKVRSEQRTFTVAIGSAFVGNYFLLKRENT
jgi:uncharacterized protein YaaR (DUF327 family)